VLPLDVLLVALGCRLVRRAGSLGALFAESRRMLALDALLVALGCRLVRRAGAGCAAELRRMLVVRTYQPEGRERKERDTGKGEKKHKEKGEKEESRRDSAVVFDRTWCRSYAVFAQ
jgi:hypothetical protein